MSDLRELRDTAVKFFGELSWLHHIRGNDLRAQIELALALIEAISNKLTEQEALSPQDDRAKYRVARPPVPKKGESV